MGYFLYQLQFDTPVHFGTAEEGGKLEQAGIAYHADTLFSALCCELAEQGAEDELNLLLEYVKKGQLRFSDLLPWQEVEGDIHYYLPKPLLPAADIQLVFPSLAERILFLNQRKKMQQVAYLRASKVPAYLTAQQKGRAYPVPKVPNFGQMQMIERVNCRQEDNALPYFVKTFTFAPNCGLYGIVFASDEAMMNELQKIFISLGLSGIGGKRSSGYGKFHFADDPYNLEAAFSDDDQSLYQFLEQQEATWQIALSPVLPQTDEINNLEHSWYHLLRRSGFIANATAQQKRDSVYMLSPGSCFRKRLQGSMAVVGKNNSHDVLRYGLGMYAGVKL